MTTRKTFALPDLGEGLAEGEVLTWLVAVGDTVALNQPIAEVETAKAAVELPSPYAGVVAELHAQVGEVVEVGAPLLTVELADTGGGGASPPSPESEAAPESGTGPETEAAAGGGDGSGRTAVLVGYGPRTAAATRRPRRRPEPGRPESPAPPQRTGPGPAAAPAGGGAAAPSGAPVPDPAPARALASPPVRKRARELGVDLAAVAGSGPGGVVTRSDLEAAAAGGGAGGAPAAAEPAPVPTGSRPAERRVPVTGVRRATAAAMVESAFTAPHVTTFLAVDATEAMALRERLAGRPELDGIPVSPLLLVARALLLAVRRHPGVNARWDAEAQEIVEYEGVNLGIAAATPRGLIVPTVKDADRLSLPDLARALRDLTVTAREGRTTPADLQGGTITITNVGVFGADSGTPILVPGQAAILCLGAVRPRPWVHEGELAVRQVVELSLSFDHRLVDGELGARFLADVGALLTDPGLALAWC